MTQHNHTSAAVALFAAKSASASDAGFSMVAAGALAFIANHAAPSGEKLEMTALRDELRDMAFASWAKSHAYDMVSAAQRAARKIWGEKQFLASIMGEPSLDAACTLVTAELRTIAAAHSPSGQVSLRALFEALAPVKKSGEKAGPDLLAKAVKALATLADAETLDLSRFSEVETAFAALKARVVAEQMEANAAAQAAAAAAQVRANAKPARKAKRAA